MKFKRIFFLSSLYHPLSFFSILKPQDMYTERYVKEKKEKVIAC
jgi:hypothetical protein